MKPAPFEYAAPNTVAEAISLLASSDEDDVKILAGGQSLMPLINMRLARPQLLVDLGRVRELDYIHDSDGGVAIGAMTTKRTVEESELIRSRHPLFHESTVLIGHPQIRNRGTVGGSMAQADPAAEYPAVALALDMQMVAQGPNGQRVSEADDFFITYLTTALEAGELLTEVRVPELAPGTGWSFQEVARRHGDFAMAGAVAILRVEGGRCAGTRIVVFGVADRANRMSEAEGLVDGEAPDAALFERAGQKVADAIEDPLSDVHASAEYRTDLARVLATRALAEAYSRAVGG
jgi:CO/xanthine dehydrogenase FAD-binding subunit